MYSHVDGASQLASLKEESNHLFIDRTTLAQYISYARNNIVPLITPEAEVKLIEAYVDMRK
jgi:DNA replicative helicase MCM subunit Mcm2 (Cdc46/Mcm family)